MALKSIIYTETKRLHLSSAVPVETPCHPTGEDPGVNRGVVAAKGVKLFISCALIHFGGYLLLRCWLTTA